MVSNVARSRGPRLQSNWRRLVMTRFLLFAFLLMIALLVSPRPAFAATQVIEFPKEELAAESVLPVFDRPEATKSRLVTTAKRIELGLTGTYAMTEAFYNPLAIGGMLTYHFDETHGINLFASMNMKGISNYADQLNPIRDQNGNATSYANLQYAPAPKYVALANYQFTAFYGKISLTKESVMNLHLYGLAGLGMVGIGDSSNVAGSIGIGQKFYFGRSFALRFDMRALAYSGPDPISRNLSLVTSEQPASSFDSKLQLQTLLSVSGVYLLPSF